MDDTMSRRRAAALPRCRDCGARVVFLRSPYTGNWRPFAVDPVDGRTHVGARAYPVEASRAWHFDALVEELMIRRGCLRTEAEDEVYDMAWHVPHDCRTTPTEPPEEEVHP